MESLRRNAALEKLAAMRIKREKTVLEIEGFLNAGHRLFKNDGTKQEAFLHKSSKNRGIMQFTYFDDNGPVGDFEGDTLKVVARKIYEYGFSPCESKDFEYSVLANSY